MMLDSVIKIKDSEPADIEPIALGMRQSDINEIWTSNNLLPKEALEKGLRESETCWTALYGEEPVAMFGIVPISDFPGEAMIWFLSTESADQHKLAWGRTSKYVVRAFQKIYPKLYNYVDVRNTKSIEWLQWLGAEFLEPAPYGVMKMPFQLFVLKGPENV